MSNTMISRLSRLFRCCVATVLLACAGTVVLGTQNGSSESPLMSDPELLKGVDAYMSGDYDGCYKLFRGAYEKNPGLSPPGVLMAQLFSSDGKYLKMHEYLEKAAQDHPTDPETFFQLGQIALKEGRFVECRLLIDKGNSVLEQLEKSTQGKSKEFSSRLDELFRQAYSLQANFAQSKNDFAAAEKFVRKITSRNPDDSDAWTSLGFLLFKQDKNEEARQAFAQAKKLDGSLSADWLV
ncbi:MAG: tetratricopeptide repeat protein, partial [Planctomycetia bacterium]|nr:tetratricopeptide repeat protein [Planctomycetia bacterium]